MAGSSRQFGGKSVRPCSREPERLGHECAFSVLEHAADEAERSGDLLHLIHLTMLLSAMDTDREAAAEVSHAFFTSA
jgi:hypothetical protein